MRRFSFVFFGLPNVSIQSIKVRLYQKSTKCITEDNKKLLPKGAKGKAFKYSVEWLDEASNYSYKGNVEIANNGIENTIRPIALCRKKRIVL